MDIHTCCKNGNFQKLQQLIAENADVNEKDNNGCSPL